MYNYALCLFTFREIDCRLKATQRRLKLMICIIGFGRFLIWFSFFLYFFSQESRTVSPFVYAHMLTYVDGFSSSLILVRHMNRQKEMLQIDFATCN